MQVSLLSLHDYGNIIFAMCIEEESGFLGHFHDAATKFGFTSDMPESGIDRRELIVAYLWLAQHMLQNQGKLAGELEHMYVTGLQMHHLFKDYQKDDVRSFYTERAKVYEQVAKLAPSQVDLVDVSQPVCRNVWRNWPEMEVHLPRLGMIMTHLMTGWIVTVTRTIDELNGTPPPSVTGQGGGRNITVVQNRQLAAHPFLMTLAVGRKVHQCSFGDMRSYSFNSHKRRSKNN